MSELIELAGDRSLSAAAIPKSRRRGRVRKFPDPLPRNEPGRFFAGKFPFGGHRPMRERFLAAKRLNRKSAGRIGGIEKSYPPLHGTSVRIDRGKAEEM